MAVAATAGAVAAAVVALTQCLDTSADVNPFDEVLCTASLLTREITTDPLSEEE